MIIDRNPPAQASNGAHPNDMYQALFEEAADGIFISDLYGNYINVNPAGCQMLSYTRTELLEMSLYDLLLPADLAKEPLKLDQVLEGQPVLVRRRLRCGNGSLLSTEIRAQRISGDYLLGVVRDVSEREQFEATQRAATDISAELSKISKAFAQVTTDYDGLMDIVASTISNLLGDWVTIRLLSDDSEWLHTATWEGVHSEAGDRMRDYVSKQSLRVEPGMMVYQTVHGQKSFIVPNMDVGTFMSEAPKKFQPMLGEFPPHSLIIVPMRTQGTVIGTIHVSRLQTEQPPFTSADRDLAQDLADRAAMAIRNAELYRDLQLELNRHRKTERSLQEEQRRIQHLVETAPGVIHTFKMSSDRKGSFPYASPRITEIFGVTPDVLKTSSTPVDRAIRPEDHTKMIAGLTEAERTMSLWHGEFRVNHPQKGEIWVEGRSMPQKQPDGSILWFGFFTDVTARKQIEQALRASESRSQAVLENLSEGLILADMAGNLFYWNRAALEMHEFEDVAECNTALADFREIYEFYTLDGRKVPFEEWPIHRIYSGENLKELDLIVRRLDREWERIFRYGGDSVVDNSGNPIVFITLVDMTDSIEAQKRLQWSETWFRTIANAAPAVLWIADKNLCTTFMSSTWFELTGQSEENALGMGWQECVHPDDIENYNASYLAAVENLGTFFCDYRLRQSNGEYRWVGAEGRPLLTNDDPRQRYVGSITDIHERRLAKEEARRLNRELEIRVQRRTQQLEEANSELESFAYSVSHDLRAPLRAIDGYARIVQAEYESKLDAEGQRLLGIVSGQAQHMGELIDDLLTLSRLSRSEMRIGEVDMAALATTVFNEQTTPSEKARIDFQVQDLPTVWGDATLLRQVWSNLIANAIKFSSKKEHPHIEIECSQAGDERIYSVQDNGAGFDMRYVEKLFGIFQRLHSEREFEGTGVGLAIVQRMVHRHGGRVWAEGAVGQGATIFFALPADQPQGANDS